MTTHLLRLLLACSAATGCLSAQAPTDAAATKPPAAERSSGMKVGVVDLGRILADYPRSIEARKKIDELKVEFQKQIDEMTKRVDDARLLRDSYQRGTREFYEQDLAVKVQLQLVEGRSKILESELRRKQDEFLVLMLDDMPSPSSPRSRASPWWCASTRTCSTGRPRPRRACSRRASSGMRPRRST
jgi:Skp family chaperone for outer membrane proteins